MKNLTVFLVAFFSITATVVAQAPYSFNYQAVLRNDANDPLSNEAVNVEIKIWKDGSSVEYCETYQNMETTELGLVTLEIGTGTHCNPNKDLSEIDWSSGIFSLQVMVTTQNGNITSQENLNSVPFALYAQRASHAETVTNNDDADADPVNEIQEISFDSSANMLSLSHNGGEVDLSSISPWGTNGNGIDYISGNVGIGTATPNASLEVESLGNTEVRIDGGEDASLLLDAHSDSDASKIVFQKDGTTQGWLSYDHNAVETSQNLDFNVGQNYVLRMSGNGQVGIGTTNPQDRLHLEDGNLLISENSPSIAFREKDNSNKTWRLVGDEKDFFIRENNTSRVVVKESGNVGIATTAPIEKLDVAGHARVRGLDGEMKIFSGETNDYLYIDNDPESFSVVLNDAKLFTVTNSAVGIGTTNPTKAALEIQGHLSSEAASNYATFLYDPVPPFDNINPSVNGGKNYSIYASQRIAASALDVFSDARIKNIQGLSDNQKDLETLKQIEITDYFYKDYMAKGTKPQKKVIAQQVAEVFPQAVTTDNTEIVPDIMKSTEIAGGWVILPNHTLSQGEKVRLLFDEEAKELKVLATTKDGFQVETDEEGRVFVYGREVQDFHTVDYEAIAMLNVSATQELAKQLEQKDQEIRELREQLTRQADQYKALSAEMGEIKALLLQNGVRF